MNWNLGFVIFLVNKFLKDLTHTCHYVVKPSKFMELINKSIQHLWSINIEFCVWKSLYSINVQWQIQTFRWGMARSSRPWDKGGRGRTQNKFFWPFWSPGPLPWIRHWMLIESKLKISIFSLTSHFRVLVIRALRLECGTEWLFKALLTEAIQWVSAYIYSKHFKIIIWIWPLFKGIV